MSEYTETRKEIEKAIESRHRENEDRARHMGLVVEDKKVFTGTSRKVSLSGTAEGAEKVKNVFKAAVEKIHEEFKKQNQDLQKKINHCKQAETKLGKKEKITKRGAIEIERAAARIKESKKAQHLAGKAEHAMIDDAKFLKRERIFQKRLRQYTEKKHEKQKRHLMGDTLKW